MIIKIQSILFPYARQRGKKEPATVSKKDKVNADRIVMILLFIMVIVAAIIFS